MVLKLSLLLLFYGDISDWLSYGKPHKWVDVLVLYIYILVFYEVAFYIFDQTKKNLMTLEDTFFSYLNEEVKTYH